jgi:hypothetical protein
LKHDSGKINVWGYFDENRVTESIVLGGPVVGFQFNG